MGRQNRGETLKNVRSRAIVLSCAFVISLLLSPATHALSVEPILDTVIAVAKLNESESTSNRDGRRGLSKTEDKTPATSSSSNRAPVTTAQPTTTPGATPEPTIVAEPLEELPSIDTSEEMQPQTLYMYRPASSLTVSHAVLGATATDSVTPLQASNHGWKFFGVAWYWWLLGIIALATGVRRLSKRQWRTLPSTLQP